MLPGFRVNAGRDSRFAFKHFCRPIWNSNVMGYPVLASSTNVGPALRNESILRCPLCHTWHIQWSIDYPLAFLSRWVGGWVSRCGLLEHGRAWGQLSYCATSDALPTLDALAAWLFASTIVQLVCIQKVFSQEKALTKRMMERPAPRSAILMRKGIAGVLVFCHMEGAKPQVFLRRAAS